MPSSPTCTVNGGSTSGGVDVTASSTVTIALVDTAARTWLLEVIGHDDSQGSAPTLTIDHVARTATFTAPAAGTATILRSTVTDAQGTSDSTTFAVYVKTAGGNRVVALGETTEGSAVGWVAQLNANIRNGGGGGYTPSGSTSQFLLGNGTAATALPTGLTVSGTALSTIASGAALGATSAQASGTSTQIMHGDGSKDTVLDTTLTVGGTALSTIKSGAAAGATAIQPTGTSTQIVHGDGSKDTVLDPTITVSGTALSAIRSGAALGATAVQGSGTTSQVLLGTGTPGNVPAAALPAPAASTKGGVALPASSTGTFYKDDGSWGTPSAPALTLKSEPITGNVVYSTNADSQYDVYDLTGAPGATYTVTFKDTATRAAGTPLVVRNSTDAPQTIIDPHSVAHTIGAGCEATFYWYSSGGAYDFVPPTLHGGKGNGWWWTETARVTSATQADYVNVWTLGKLPANSVVDVEVRMSVHRASTAQDAQSVVMALSAVVDNAGAVTAFGSLFTARSITTGTMTGLWDLRVNANTFQARWFQNDAAAGTYRVFCAATVTVNTSGA